jgi:hypothetical protein
VIARHPWFEGTDTKALEVFIDLQRKMTVQEKVLGVFSMNEMLGRTAEAHKRRLHPEASDREIFVRTASHRLDRETMIRVYGWDAACPA